MLIVLDELVKKYNITFTGILHVGAHECEELESYEKYISRNKILWIEAIKEKVNISKSRYNNILIENSVVYDKIEIIDFNISNNFQSSSLLEFGTHSINHPYVKFVDSYKVQTNLLKNIISKYDIHFNFINLDIQGTELNALKGMEIYLNNIEYIYTEVNNDYVYENCCLINEIDEYLEKFNFYRVETKWFENCNWGDAFYIKNIKKIKNNTQELCNNYLKNEYIISDEKIQKYIIFKPSGRVGNALFRYLACVLFCIKFNYKYILEEDKENIEDYIYYEGLDHENDDIHFFKNSIEELKNYANKNNEIVAFNSLGFMKYKVNINNLKSNNYINKNNNNGLYVKNIFKITDANFLEYFNKNEMNHQNLIFDGYFQFNNIFMEYKNEILQYIEKHKNIHYIKSERCIIPFHIDDHQKILINDLFYNLHESLIYDISIHIRLDDFIGLDYYIEYQYLEFLFKKINFSNKKCCIVIQKPKNDNDNDFLNKCILWFEKKNINIDIQSNDVITDFNIMRNCSTLICSNSTLSWMSAYFSTNIKECYMPYNIAENNDVNILNNLIDKSYQDKNKFYTQNTKYYYYSSKNINLDILNKINIINYEKKSCYLGGCVLNCDKYLKNVFKNINIIRDLFNEFKVIIAYDHSNDNSLSTLHNLKNMYSNKFEIIIVKNKNKMSNFKTENISNARNSIIEYIKNDLKSKNCELLDNIYMIMMDIDDVCENKINIDVLKKYMYRNDYDGLSFNRQDYYDIWALSIDPFLLSCWHWSPEQMKSSFVVNLIENYIKSKLLNIGENDLLECYSAFNGFALYRLSKFINSFYSNNIFKSSSLLSNEQINNNINEINKLTNKDNLLYTKLLEDCEHRHFHLKAINDNNAKIRISPLFLFSDEKYNDSDNDSEEFCNFVSSRGILKSCTVKSSTPISSINKLYNYDFSKLCDGATLYICNYAIPEFSRNDLNKLNCKIILVSGDSDCTVPNELFPNAQDFINFIENDKIIHWYSQNCIISHPKVTCIPIGMDYHTMVQKDSEWGLKLSSIEQENMIISIKNKSVPFWNRYMKCYSNFHFRMDTKYGNDRIDAINQINKNLVFFENDKVEREESWLNQSRYAFVISPHGNGLDCHRTWEALLLGCIPIVKNSSIIQLYDNLPVLIVNDWSDVTDELLQKVLIDFKEKHLNNNFDYNRLQLKYWINKINEKLEYNPSISRIPKIIYQTWNTKNLPEEILNIQKKILEINPGYKIELYDDNDIEDFIKNNYDNTVYNAYLKLNVGASKADFWRYLILYKYGGIYLDIDSIINKPLDQLIKYNDCIITREGCPENFVQWLLMFVPNHPILKLAIEICVYNIINEKTNFIVDLTGPGVYTRAVNNILLNYYPKKNINLYFEKDDDLNVNLKDTKCRFYGIDYEEYASWKHEYSDLLYKNKKYWREETQIFKNNDNLKEHINIFTEIYEKSFWGSNNNSNYNGSSGGGSKLENNINTYIPFLKQFINDRNIKSVVDLGCGDFLCGEYIYNDLDIKYYGYDAYEKVINNNKNIFLGRNNKYNFNHLDFYNNRENIISSDLCIIKDVLQHWKLEDIYIFIDYLTTSSKFKYILLCNCSYQNVDNTDINTGEFRALSSNYYPLKKYNPISLYSFDTKEVCLIDLMINNDYKKHIEYLKVYSFDKKIRLGLNQDGGYVIGELNINYDCYISAGVSIEESFSRDFINKYNMNKSNNYAFDGTIEEYPYEYTKEIQFIKKNIDNFNNNNYTNLLDLINKYDKIFLKMDIEGYEYKWLLSLNETHLQKFTQIVIEFHGINDDSWNCEYIDKISCFKKLFNTHYLIHAHGNNNGSTKNNIPDVIELTYVNKNLFYEELELNINKLPIENLDYPNCLKYNDLNLNFFPFVKNNNINIINLFDENIHTKYIYNITNNINFDKLNFSMFNSFIINDYKIYYCERLCINNKNGLLFKNNFDNNINLIGFEIEAQDPRIIIINNIIYVVFISLSPYKNQKICITITEYNNFQPKYLRIRGIELNIIEKNWAPFVKDNKLFFVYNYDPLIIITYDFNAEGYCDIIYKQNNISLPINTSITFLRGGSNLQYYNDKYYIGCVHSRIYLNNIFYHFTHIILLDTIEWKIVYLSKPVLYNYINNNMNNFNDINIILKKNPYVIQDPISLIYIEKNKYLLSTNICDNQTLLYEVYINIDEQILNKNYDIGYFDKYIEETNKKLILNI